MQSAYILMNIIKKSEKEKKMNKELLRKQFEWQKSSSNYIITISLLLAWGFGAKQLNFQPTTIVFVYGVLMILLGIFLIMSIIFENKYGSSLFDERRNNDNKKILNTIFIFLYSIMGIILIIFGIYLIKISF